MPAKRALSAALALLLVAAIPARATSVPTITVIDSINPGAGSSYAMDSSDSVALGDWLYFRADDDTHGEELWRTNGTTTELVQDINSGTDSSGPEYFTALGDYLYFAADDGTHGDELWRTDGTTAERVPFPVADQEINCDGCYDTAIVAVGGRLYTTVYSDAIGHEFAYLDEPTYVLPETNRDSSVWTTTLVIVAGLTAAASIVLRVRGAKRA
jgi:ELWxxDGT repeat protein